MKKLWLFVFLGAFLLSMVGLTALRMGTASSGTAVEAADASEVCVGSCGDEWVSAFGSGRVVGDLVHMPNSSDSSQVVLAVRGDCDLCQVPVLAVAESIEQASAASCDLSTFGAVTLVVNREADIEFAEELVTTLKEMIGSKVEVRSDFAPDIWPRVLLTDRSPAALVVDSSSNVLGQWIGFDPGHYADLVATTDEAFGCLAEADRVNASSAIAARSPGDRVPDWILSDLRLVDRLPALLVIADANCAYCAALEPLLPDAMAAAVELGISPVYLDATSTQEFMDRRQSVVTRLADSEIGKYLSDTARASGMVHSAIEVPAEEIEAERTVDALREYRWPDPERQAAFALTSGTVPMAVLVDASGYLHERVRVGAGESADAYRERLAHALRSL